MKTIFSRRLMAPIVVMILGGAGAFVTTSMKSANVNTPVTGYRFVSQQKPCVASIDCQRENNDIICTSGSSQLFEKDSPNSCPLPLYKLEP